MSDNGQNCRRAGRGRRLLMGANVSTSIIFAVAVVVMVNYLSAVHFYVRKDFSRAGLFSLSAKTEKVLADLKSDITVYVVFRSGSPEREETVRDIMSLLAEFRYCAQKTGAARFRVEKIDPDRDIVRTEILRRKYDLHTADVVIFDSGARSKSVPERSIVEYEYTMPESGVSPSKVRKAFLGEQVFLSAVLNVTQEKKPVVYFATGHDEHGIDDFQANAGYSEIVRKMRLENLDVRSVSLTEHLGIPGDCDLFVVAGPKVPLHKSEIAAISSLLKANRSMLLLADSGQASGLEQLLHEWGVKFLPEKVVERTLVLAVGDKSLTPIAGTGEELYIRNYGSHPITASLGGLTTVLYLPAAVVPAGAQSGSSAGREDMPRVSVLAASAENSWLEADYSEDPPVYNPELDVKGPIPVAVAVEKGLVSGVNAELKPTRIVVIGDSDFISNGRGSGGNEDFFLNAVNWLVERDELIDVGPKAYNKVPLQMDDRQAAWVYLLVVAGIPACVAMLGLLVWLRRVT